MEKHKRVLLVFSLVIICAIVNQTTKTMARHYLYGNGIVSYWGDVIRLQYAKNPGAFLSIGAELPIHIRSSVLSMGNLLVVALVFLYAIFYNSLKSTAVVALSLICGGGVGNIIDRFCFDGYVTDFMNLGIGVIRTGIFNVADFALTAGIVMLALCAVRFGGGTTYEKVRAQ